MNGSDLLLAQTSRTEIIISDLPPGSLGERFPVRPSPPPEMTAASISAPTYLFASPEKP